VRWLGVRDGGAITLASLEHALAELPRGAVVALSAVTPETGVIPPVREAERLVRAASARLHVDAVQAAGRLDPELWAYGDSLALAAHKIRGPKCIGALVTAPGGRVTPVLLGGAQERGLRPGTPDPAAALGFGLAADHALAGPGRYAPLAELRDRVDRELAEWSSVNGDAPRAPHVTNRSFVTCSGDELVAALDLEGIRVSSGSACSAGTSEPSPVIGAMVGEVRARGAVRVSLGEETTEGDVERLISAVCSVVARSTSVTSRTS
jgi:cysteine desulfurase